MLTVKVKMSKARWNEWIAALRSDKYSQGRRGMLFDGFDHCCLGVLCDIAGVDLEQYGSWSGLARCPNELVVAIPRELRSRLANLNDSGKYDFNQIADFLEMCEACGIITLDTSAEKV